MTRTHRAVAGLAVLLLILSRLSSSAQEPPARGVSDESKKTPLITVQGDAEVLAPPDRATVRLGATAQESEAAAAQASVNNVVSNALKAIEKVGIPRSSIQTTGLTLSPIYAPQKPSSPDTPRVVAYRAGNTIEVIVADLKLVGPVIDAGVSSGANRLEGVSFQLKDDLQYRTSALASAVGEARTKAEAIARALGVKLGPLAEVTENSAHILPRPQSFGRATAFMAEAASTPVEPGELRVHGSVTVRYEIDAR